MAMVNRMRLTGSAIRAALGAPQHKKSHFNSCVAGKLIGTKPGNKGTVISNFIAAAKACQGK